MRKTENRKGNIFHAKTFIFRIVGKTECGTLGKYFFFVTSDDDHLHKLSDIPFIGQTRLEQPKKTQIVN